MSTKTETFISPEKTLLDTHECMQWLHFLTQNLAIMSKESLVFLPLQLSVGSEQLDQRRCRVLQREGYQGFDYPFSVLLNIYLKS